MFVDVRPYAPTAVQGRHVLPAAQQMEIPKSVSIWADKFFRPACRRLLPGNGGGCQSGNRCHGSGKRASTRRHLEGGYVEALCARADQPLLRMDRLPERDQSWPYDTWGHASPAKDHSSSLSLVDPPFRVDPTAVFLYVAPSEVAAVAKRFTATSPFDKRRRHLDTNRGDALHLLTCMLEELQSQDRAPCLRSGGDHSWRRIPVVPDLTPPVRRGCWRSSLGYSPHVQGSMWPSSMPRCHLYDAPLLPLVPRWDRRDARLTVCAVRLVP